MRPPPALRLQELKPSKTSPPAASRSIPRERCTKRPPPPTPPALRTREATPPATPPTPPPSAVFCPPTGLFSTTKSRHPRCRKSFRLLPPPNTASTPTQQPPCSNSPTVLPLLPPPTWLTLTSATPPAPVLHSVPLPP